MAGPAAVDEDEALEICELRDGVVARHDGLHPLLAADPGQGPPG